MKIVHSKIFAYTNPQSPVDAFNEWQLRHPKIRVLNTSFHSNMVFNSYTNQPEEYCCVYVSYEVEVPDDFDYMDTDRFPSEKLEAMLAED